MAKNKNRDEFTPSTIRTIERQALSRCSNPMCRLQTHSATPDGKGEIRIGVASHICAAAPGGPRYYEKMTQEERRSINNAIWLCAICARIVDAKSSKVTVETLHAWKRQTIADSWHCMNSKVSYVPVMQAPTPDELRDRVRTAAKADLAVFRRTAKWPGTTVALTLKVDHVDEALTTRALARAVTTLDDLILVAAPGMGKTTTLFQVAEGILEIGNGTPLVVPLGDWATEDETILDSILKRPAFRKFSEDEFRKTAAQPGVVLLLDGWNEMDTQARVRARVQVARLKAELPEIGLFVTSRRQVLDVPFDGTRVDLLPLNEKQQKQIAIATRGNAGAKILDQAWRAAGVRELVTIPLYLKTLLALPDGAPFPTTKEEILRHFVAAHEMEPSHAEALHASLQGLQQKYLEGLAVFATRTANTAIIEDNARRSIFDVETLLADKGQITVKPQPDAALDVLVSNHVLMRSGETPGYSFQHQQFQEWYASYYVERLMTKAVSDEGARDKLKAEVLNQRPWEGAILFAVERSARGDSGQKTTCSAAILAALEVDPMLAAEMIFHATGDVWGSISAKIRSFVDEWHTPGTVDRAFRFIITSGRPEFDRLVWPLITHEDDQVHLLALRAANRFRPSVLGGDARKRIADLVPDIRKNVLHEIALNGGMEGLDFATAIAKADGDPNVKATVVDALSFRRADRYIADLLSDAGEETYDLLAERGHIDDVAVDAVQKGLEAARARRKAAGVSHFERLRSLVYAQGESREAEITEIVAEMEIDQERSGDMHMLYEVQRRHPKAFADGLLRRVREDRKVFYGADDILASAGFALEDEELLKVALGETNRFNNRAEAAASVLGPKSVGRMIEAYFDTLRHIQEANGKKEKAKVDRYYTLRDRIGHTPGASLIAAVQTRATSANNEEITELAGLLSRQTDGDDARGRPFDAEGLASIGAMAQDWGKRLLASRDAKRGELASIATLISCAPSLNLLPILKRLFDEELRRYRAFREEAIANGWRHGDVANEARTLHTYTYQRAFMAVKAPETATLMKEYLVDDHYGEMAATVLAAQWSETNEPRDERRFTSGVDFSRVKDRRAARAANPAETSAEAEAIFGVIDTLIPEDATDTQKKLAVALGTVGARLPHGQREATIQRLITLASRQARADLLLALVLSGEEIEIKLVADGITETFEAAKKEPWILTDSDAYQLRVWLRLLPFVDRLLDVPAVVCAMPEAQRNPHLLEEMVQGLGESSSDDAEEVLFKLAEEDPRFYQNHQWRATVMRLGTASAARRVVDLVATGTLNGKSTDSWGLVRQVGDLMSEYPEIRVHVYELLKDGAGTEGLVLLARAVAHNPGLEGLLLLINLERKHKPSFITRQSIESAVTEHVPSEDWEGAYNVVPVPAIELRKKLLAMVTESDADNPAARCLNAIDRIRDDYGAPEQEPRHPDLASGKQWPMPRSEPAIIAGGWPAART